MCIESDYISYNTVVFATSNARVRFYQMLDRLHPSQVCFCDTDSAMFIYDETKPKHKIIVLHACSLPVEWWNVGILHGGISEKRRAEHRMV